MDHMVKKKHLNFKEYLVRGMLLMICYQFSLYAYNHHISPYFDPVAARKAAFETLPLCVKCHGTGKCQVCFGHPVIFYDAFDKNPDKKLIKSICQFCPLTETRLVGSCPECSGLGRQTMRTVQ